MGEGEHGEITVSVFFFPFSLPPDRQGERRHSEESTLSSGGHSHSTIRKKEEEVDSADARSLVLLVVPLSPLCPGSQPG